MKVRTSMKPNQTQLTEKFDPRPFRRSRFDLTLIVYVLLLVVAVVGFTASTARGLETSTTPKTTMIARIPVCAEDDVITFEVEGSRRTNFVCANFDDLVLDYVVERATTWDPGLRVLLQTAAECHLDRVRGEVC